MARTHASRPRPRSARTTRLRVARDSAAAALWNFSLVSVATPVEILRLLSLAYKWPASGESDAYWVHFQESVDPALMDDFDTFSMIAAQAGIDR
ncbi:MAG TPA: hypothetical protein VIK91_22570 [Nannocystis sp.]